MAIDVGTTNLTIFLTKQGKTIDKLYVQNPQKKFGADILTRYTATLKNTKIRQEMHKIIVEALSKSIDKICESNNINRNQLKKISIVGNTMMYCFLLDLNPAPFISRKKVVMETTRQNYHKIELDLPQMTELIIPPPIVSYIGSDALALILQTRMHESKDIILVIDFGTNTEIVIGNRHEIIVTSVAGGAAFEDSSISVSSPAQDGAIHSVKWKNEMITPIFFGKKASSICGSGVIDLTAELRKHNIVDKTGRFVEPKHDFAVSKHVRLTQKDIRSVQLAKSATISAINLLIKERKARKEEIKGVYITGIFGNHLNISNAKYIGLLPRISVKEIELVEDAATKGAAKLLTEKYNAKKIYSKIAFVNLPMKKEFRSQFLKNMVLSSQEL